MHSGGGAADSPCLEPSSRGVPRSSYVCGVLHSKSVERGLHAMEVRSLTAQNVLLLDEWDIIH
jgi:hypothetical protein